jgi:hypothetical protein
MSPDPPLQVGGPCGAMRADIVVQPTGRVSKQPTRGLNQGTLGAVIPVYLPVGLGRLRSRLRLRRGILGLLRRSLFLADWMTAISHRSILASGD